MDISAKQKQHTLIFTSLGGLGLISSIIYLISLNGMKGLLEYLLYMQILVGSLLLLAIGLIFISVILFIAIKNKRLLIKRSMRPFRTWGLIALFISVFIIGGTNLSLNIHLGDKGPILLMTERHGINGINNIAINYVTEQPQLIKLHWGIGTLQYWKNDSSPTRSHIYELTDLIPNTEYFYQFSGDSTIYTFRTPHNTLNTFKFAVAGDPHYGGLRNNPDAVKRMVQVITNNSRQNEAFFSPGDLVYFGNIDSQWQNIIQILLPLISTLPGHVTIGNHDSMWGGTKYYLDYFSPLGLSIQNGTQFYQHIVINGLHFFFLYMEWGTETYTGEQAQWFEDQLKTISPEEWIIVMSHTFYYSTGSYSSGAQWFDNPKTIASLVPLFDQYDVDLVISGHVHDTQILQNMNTTYIISGAFGGVLEPDPTTQSIAQQLYFNNKDYAHIEIAIEDMVANITVVHENGHELFSTRVYQ